MCPAGFLTQHSLAIFKSFTAVNPPRNVVICSTRTPNPVLCPVSMKRCLILHPWECSEAARARTQRGRQTERQLAHSDFSVSSLAA